jgi:hypothetical protein
MDLPPPVQDPEPLTPDPGVLEARVPAARVPDARATGTEDQLARRLEAVEARLVALGAHIEQMEASLQQVVRDEGHTVSTQIRYTLSELGRRLALDLPQTLDRHRQMIVAELRSPAGLAAEGQADGEGEGEGEAQSAPEGPVTGEAAGEAGAATGAATGAAAVLVETNAGSDADGRPAADGEDTGDSSGDGGKRRRRRRRGEG